MKCPLLAPFALLLAGLAGLHAATLPSPVPFDCQVTQREDWATQKTALRQEHQLISALSDERGLHDNVVTAILTEGCQKLEGPDNQGTATVERDGTKLRVSGAVATPFAMGGTQARVSGQVRLLAPASGRAPDFGSAMLGLYGKDRSQRLMAFIAFKVPGMPTNNCEIGFLAHKSVRRPASFGQWYTLKFETSGGIARMKAWADGTPEPDWMAEQEIDPILSDIDATWVSQNYK